MTAEDDKDIRIRYLEGREAYLSEEVDRLRGLLVERGTDLASSRLEATRLQIDLNRVLERINLLTRWYEEQKKDAEQARMDRHRVLYGQWGYNEALRKMDQADRERFMEQIIVSNFLGGVGLTPEKLGRMYPKRQEVTVSRLRRLAVKAFAGPDSWNPNDLAFNAIMIFLNYYDPRIGRNQLPPGNR